jgi:hypothetical protein
MLPETIIQPPRGGASDWPILVVVVNIYGDAAFGFECMIQCGIVVDAKVIAEPEKGFHNVIFTRDL